VATAATAVLVRLMRRQPPRLSRSERSSTGFFPTAGKLPPGLVLDIDFSRTID